MPPPNTGSDAVEDMGDALLAAAERTAQVLDGNPSSTEVFNQILENQLYMLNVMRWLVSREQERIRSDPE